MLCRLAFGISLAALAVPVLSQDASSSSSSSKSPSPQDWANLKSQVGGRLYPGVPWPKPCFSNYNGLSTQPDETQCQYVQQNYFNSHLNRSQAFGGYAATQFETCMSTGEQCELDWQSPTNALAFSPPQRCDQGSIPTYYIDVKGKDDVLAALKFSKSKNVPLVIKNTGHDFQGRSSGPGSLALWMHNLKYISHNPRFTPEGCQKPGQSAVTYGAGQQFAEIYQFAEDNKLVIVGGSDQSVGAAGGWGQGGGHSSLSPAYGMGADRALQYKVVTPDGVFRTANACQNSDLFYALRGGGGGTFGVVLEATVMASPATSFRVANINWPINENSLKQILDVFVDSISTIATQGWGGYLTPTAGNLILTTPNLDLPAAQKSVQALIDVSTKLGGVSNVTEIPSFLGWFTGYVRGTSGVQDPIGLPVAMTSRLIPAKNHATPQSRAQLSDALFKSINGSTFSQIHITTPYGFKGTDGEDTSINPLWRTSLYQVLYVNGWLWNETLADRKAAYAASTTAANLVREITPGSGAYHNEADIHEPNHEVSFWGKNYNRLLTIKKKYDPDHILDCWHCVGWKSADSPRFKCYI